MDDTRKVIRIGIGIILLLAAIAGVYYFVTREPGKSVEEKPLPVSSPPATESTAPAASLEALSLPSLELDKSDDILRRLAQDISSHPGLSMWMKTRELIRRFVAAVDNIANGISPKAQIDFFAPKGDFKAVKRDGGIAAVLASYDRYNPVADVFISLDARAAARLYNALKPLLQQAYKELGYPDADFHDTLTQAVAELLATPVVEGRVLLEKKVASYAYVDEMLEGLSQAQKQFLRMGPDNVQIIQTKLRELAVACGIPEYRLPKARIYAPE
ncbi:MAG: DUF3014 domain-containing protein [Candidatus Aminicenantes bacterium]|nr:DUF3014 domain-containing protein [Candidatus Aminicenantes bacterium]